LAQLILGPILRYVGTTQATVWVETGTACRVTVLGAAARTFCVEGHHFALVVVNDLEPGTSTPYEVHLDDERAWPLDDERPPCVIVTRENERQARLVFGSCRIGAPHRPPYTENPADHPLGFGVDALWAYSRRLQNSREEWPDCLLLLGDQVYADEVSPDTLTVVDQRVRDAERRGDMSSPPPDQVANFEEYTRLHRESWSDPDIRWLLSTVPSTMIFDDHDVNDDWNISESWVAEMNETPWWDERVVGAFMAYWIYQHIGNLSPPEMESETLLADVYGDDDAGPRLREFARRANREPTSSRFAFYRDFGRTRLIVIDARAARVVTDGQRDIVDSEEWEWIREHSRGDFDHIIIGSTVPIFLAHAIHNLEAWNEAVCAGRWGRLFVPLGEKIRRALDMDHWAAFQRSFRAMVELLQRRASGPPQSSVTAPATIMLISGDVHHAYIAEVDVGSTQQSRIYQLVCSPFRKPLTPKERRVVRFFFTRGVAMFSSAVARLAGVRPTPARWRFLSGPTFDNSVGLIDVDGRDARVVIRGSGTETDEGPDLIPLQSRDLTSGPRVARRSRSRRARPPRGGS
jgi:PhoD-like phosphatase